MQNSKKQDIIIELGAENIRVGLVGDKVPRKTIKSKTYLRYNDDSLEKYQILLEQLLFNICFSYINCACTGKTVVLLEKVYTDRRILEIMARILFKKLKIQKIEMALSCVTPLYLTGKYSGIVVSGGASSFEMMAVYEGYPLFRQFQHIPIGTQSLNKFIRDDLALINSQTSLDILKQISQDQINDLRINYGSIPLSQDTIIFPINYKKLRLKFIPNKIKYNIFYGNPQNEDINIAYTLLKLIDSLPEQCLNEVCANIVLAGGFWRTKNMQKLFKKHLIEQFSKFSKLETLRIKQKINFVSWSFNPIEISWIGCSIGASIRSLESMSLRKAEYLEHGYCQKVMKNYFLSG